MARRKDDLYFMLNPALGIIKIGISNDVAYRRRTLEHACGVPLEVMAVIEGGAEYEQDLHLVFAETRLRGEWFTPSEALLAIIDAPGTIPDLLERERETIRGRLKAREAENAAAREAVKAEREREREARRRFEAEQARLKQAREAKAAEFRRKREEATRAAVRAEMERWRERSPELAARVIEGHAEREASDRRRWLADQRARNATMVGVREV